jgi:hypothetical protein
MCHSQQTVRKRKAFELETRGTVLGTGFCSTDMTWFLSKEKVEKITRRCMDVRSQHHISLLQTQQLMGTVNDFSQLCRFTKFFRHSGNRLLSQFGTNENILIPVPDQLKKDILVICNAAQSTLQGLPIASRKSFPPLSAITFYTDAAGAKYTKIGGKYVIAPEEFRGVSCIEGDTVEEIRWWSRMDWPQGFLESKDEKGVEFGRKSTTLECIGILIPFVSFPEKIAGRHVVFNVDNKAVHYGWTNGGVKNDTNATEVLKAVHILASFLGCQVHVNHVLRMTNDMADLAQEEKCQKTACSGPR